MGKIRTAAQTLALSAWILGLVLICAPAARAQSWGEVVLHALDGTNGNQPEASLIQGSDGNFYGTTVYGGANQSADNGAGAGMVFEVTPSGGLTTLYSFCSQANCTDGEAPYASLIQGSDGNFYGTTELGGANGLGTVFRLTPSGTLTTLYSFCSVAGVVGGFQVCLDGDAPMAGVIQGGDGNFYGTTFGGGDGAYNNPGAATGGTVFELTPSGGFTILYSFCSLPNCADGFWPFASLIQGIDGKFYGTTYGGGSGSSPVGGESGGGTVFELTPSGTLTTLYSFCSQTGCADGALPEAGLIQGIDGNFYGTTTIAGAAGYSVGGGTVFELTSSGGLITLYSFCSVSDPKRGQYCLDGLEPWAGVIQGSDDNFYGTTLFGGANLSVDNGAGGGTVFELTPGGGLTTLYSFCSHAHCTDGKEPWAGVIQGTDGNFYGTTGSGGANNDGTVFEVEAFVPVKLKIEPTTLKFGTVEVGSQKGPKNVTVTNPKGSKKKPGVTVVMRGYGGAASSYSVTSNDCGASLAPGAKCTIGITFTPAQAGAQNATLTIFDNAEHERQSVKLTGEGNAPK